MRRYYWVLLALCVLCLCVPAFSDVVSAPSSQPTTSPTVGAPPPSVFIALWAGLAAIFAGIQKGDMWAVLIAVCNLLVALMKNEWVQAKLKVWSENKEPWLTKKMKVALALGVGVVLVALFDPSKSGLWYRTLLKGLNVGLCSIGLYSIWKHFIRWEKKE